MEEDERNTVIRKAKIFLDTGNPEILVEELVNNLESPNPKIRGNSAAMIVKHIQFGILPGEEVEKGVDVLVGALLREPPGRDKAGLLRGIKEVHVKYPEIVESIVDSKTSKATSKDEVEDLKLVRVNLRYNNP